MPQYLIAVHHDAAGRSRPAAEMAEIVADVSAVNQKMMDAGVFVFAGGLHDPSFTTTVDPRSGKVELRDGPYVETKEYMGGFCVIEAADLDAALDWARQGAVACREPVELRPFLAGPPEGDA